MFPFRLSRTFPFFIITLLFATLTTKVQAKDIKVKSAIKDVTVFLQGAQVVRHADVTISKGTHIYIFKGLSSHIDPESIQAKGVGDITIMGVTQKMDYLGSTSRTTKTSKLRDSLDILLKQRSKIQNELGILNGQEQYLQVNRLVKGNNDNLVASDFEQITRFFYKQMAEISRKRLRFNDDLKELQKRIRKFQNQIQAEEGKQRERWMDVFVEIKSSKVLTAELRLSYYVFSAGWSPTYDVRVDDITKPLQLVYKARVFQNSGEDWDKVKLTFSNANPNESGDLPKLTPYYLNYGAYRPQKHQTAARTTLNYLGLEQREISGRIMDVDGEPVSFALVSISGTTISDFADANGYFKLTAPDKYSTVTVSALGFQSTNHYLSGDYAMVRLNENTSYRVEEKVLGKAGFAAGAIAPSANSYYYSTPSQDYNATKKRMRTDKSDGLFRNNNSDAEALAYKPLEVQAVENQTTIEFKVDQSYSITSNSKPILIDMKSISINASYEYRTVPKLEESAYLIAQVTDWTRHQLLAGVANLYFENTYIGKSALDVRFFSDTLDISLGRDKNVIVKRTKVKEYSGKKLLGSDQVARRQFDIEIRNNKVSPIHLVAFDQIPISTIKDITVEVKDLNSASKDSKTGELEWRFDIAPNQMKKPSFKYNVKYPSGRSINLE